MTSNKQRPAKPRKLRSSLAQTSARVDIKTYIYGSKQLTAMVQTDIQRIEEETILPAQGTRLGYWVVIGNEYGE